MKNIVFLAMVLGLMACSSTNKERKIASVEKSHNCSLVKHKTKNYFKVYKGEAPLFKHWFDKKYAEGLLERSVEKGKCI